MMPPRRMRPAAARPMEEGSEAKALVELEMVTVEEFRLPAASVE